MPIESVPHPLSILEIAFHLDDMFLSETLSNTKRCYLFTNTAIPSIQSAKKMNIFCEHCRKFENPEYRK